MNNYNTRDIAVNLVMDITQEEAYSNLALKKELQKYPDMKREDKAFITEITNGTIRNIIYIDYVIAQFSSVKFNKIKKLILNILRISVYQLLFMDKVPASAVCNEAVKLSKKRGHSALSGFVNGVLRNIERNKENIKLPDEKKEPVKYLSILYSYPEWIIKYFLEDYDFEFVKQMCIKNNISPKVNICVNTLKTDTERLKKELEEENIVCEDGKYFTNSLRLLKTADITRLKSYNNGEFYVQDESSMLAVNILDPKEGEYIIDVCAAPGGKSILAAQKMNNKGIVSARDIYEHKLNLMKETVQRLGINIIELMEADAEIKDEKSILKADRVLIDAPCSGLGILAKKADIKLKKKAEDIEILQKIQRNILTVCSEYVKLNGVLVYSTCTMTKEENIENVKWFVDNFPFELEDISEFIPENMECSTAKEGYVQIYPHINDIDGFFVARMRRKR